MRVVDRFKDCIWTVSTGVIWNLMSSKTTVLSLYGSWEEGSQSSRGGWMKLQPACSEELGTRTAQHAMQSSCPPFKHNQGLQLTKELIIIRRTRKWFWKKTSPQEYSDLASSCMTYKGRFRQLLYSIWWQEDFLWDDEQLFKESKYLLWDFIQKTSLKNN